MKIDNLKHIYYTASKKKHGFGVFYHSSDIDADIIDAAKDLGTYTPPFQLPQNPSEQEIKDLFPINYAYFPLNSKEKIVLLRSKYTGRTNHTPDRFGNFLSHLLILDGSNKNKIIEILKDYTFRDHITIEEEEDFFEDTEEWMMPLELNLDYSFYLSFLISTPQIFNSFLQAVDLIINGWLNNTGRNISFLSTNKNCENLIFSIFYLFPDSIIAPYSFATYINDPSKYFYKITGLVKESGITRLDEQYYKLIDVDKQLNYSPVNEFTQFLKDLIINKKYSKDSLKKYLSYFEIDTFSKELNAIPLIGNFIENINEKNITDYGIISKLKLPAIVFQDIEQLAKERNLELYFYILSYRFNSKPIHNISDLINRLKEFHKKYFENDIEFKNEFFYLFYKNITQGLSGYKGIISFNFLTEFNPGDGFSKNELEDELAVVNNMLEKASLDGNLLNKFIDKNSEFITEKYMNIFPSKIRRKYEKLLDEKKLRKVLMSKDISEFKGLKETTQFNLVSNLLWSENYKTVTTKSETIRDWRKLISKIFDNYPKFWVKFFGERYKKRDNQCSLSFFKRLFILDIINEKEYQDFFKEISLDENEKSWLREMLEEYDIPYLKENYKYLEPRKRMFG